MVVAERGKGLLVVWVPGLLGAKRSEEGVAGLTTRKGETKNLKSYNHVTK